MVDRALERVKEIWGRLRRHRANSAARHQKAEGMYRITRIWHQHDIARRCDCLRDIGESFLGSERRHDLGVGVQLYAEAAFVIRRLRAAQAWNAARC